MVEAEPIVEKTGGVIAIITKSKRGAFDRGAG